MYNNIGFYDWQTILSLLQSIALPAVVVALFLVLLDLKDKKVSKQNKQIIWALVAAWAISSIGLAAISTYNYFDEQRPGIKDAIQQQDDQYGR